VYPARLDRGKQAERAVRLFAELKRAGASVALVIANFHSTGAHFVRYREEIAVEAARLGLTTREVIFTSNLPPLLGVPAPMMTRTAIELPHRVVQDLFRLTNVYVHPSASETYSLVCQEAAMAGNLLVLNEDFPAMRELYGDAAFYVHFCSAQTATSYQPSEAAYLREVAREILDQFDLNPTLAQRTRIRQTRNLGVVYAAHFGPLLEGVRGSAGRTG
jgi:glycosyltransferase involved in cell wall biosynthesis